MKREKRNFLYFSVFHVFIIFSFILSFKSVTNICEKKKFYHHFSLCHVFRITLNDKLQTIIGRIIFFNSNRNGKGGHPSFSEDSLNNSIQSPVYDAKREILLK